MGTESGDAGDGWTTLGLDPRLLRALTKKRYRAPTAVQSQAIPLVLEGKDVVARAHTGSGKTAAYLLPAIHKIVPSAATAMGGAPPGALDAMMDASGPMDPMGMGDQLASSAAGVEFRAVAAAVYRRLMRQAAAVPRAVRGPSPSRQRRPWLRASRLPFT